ncbi:hypothetical protein CQW23_12007 [Capsicum baccatum]|uniref:Uncharacterized protein n=1 Tax=Capsicum baccatum TaxID=33114 RepID=A0A2G2WRI7_CAPBA|nr:hypothetical protein CQW23_12007 [Capsicum baccatum]
MGSHFKTFSLELASNLVPQSPGQFRIRGGREPTLLLAICTRLRPYVTSPCELCPLNFIQSCCRWLLSSLLLRGDISNMIGIAKVACEPLAEMVKNHFVDIFSVCIALHCNKKAGWEKGSAVLESSILDIAKRSEIERDKLIRTHMVSIVNTIISLASTAADPILPLFSKETIGRAIMTVVDGLLEMCWHVFSKFSFTAFL